MGVVGDADLFLFDSSFLTKGWTRFCPLKPCWTQHFPGRAPEFQHWLRDLLKDMLVEGQQDLLRQPIFHFSCFLKNSVETTVKIKQQRVGSHTIATYSGLRAPTWLHVKRRSGRTSLCGVSMQETSWTRPMTPRHQPHTFAQTSSQAQGLSAGRFAWSGDYMRCRHRSPRTSLPLSASSMHAYTFRHAKVSRC